MIPAVSDKLADLSPGRMDDGVGGCVGDDGEDGAAWLGEWGERWSS